MRRSQIWQRSRNPPPLLVYEDGLHAQGSGNRAGVLAARTPETCQHVLRGVVALGLESERTKKKRRKHQRLKQILSCAISPHLNEDWKTPEYLRQSPDWPTHGLICNANESHSHFLHAHLWRVAVWLGGPIGAGLREEVKTNKLGHSQSGDTYHNNMGLFYVFEIKKRRK